MEVDPKPAPKMFLHKDHLIEWFKRFGSTRKAHIILGAISFTESSFFPIPPDPFMIVMLFLKENSWWKLALTTTVTSVLGGVFGYGLGYLFFDIFGQRLVDFYHAQDEFDSIVQLFQNYSFMTVFTAAFTPIPYKVFTVASGFAQISLTTFIIASVLGRGLRFFILAFIMKIFGEKIGKLMFKYFNLSLIFVVIMACIFLTLKIAS